jgi:hypothetical protein
MLKRVRNTGFALVAGGLLTAGIFPAIAGAESISSGNSSMTFNLASPADFISGWTVDGVNQVASENISILNNAFSFENINALTLEGTPFFGSGIADVTYGGVVNGENFTITVKDILSGGSAGSGASGISETITLNNLGPVNSQSPIQFISFEIQDAVNYTVNGSSNNNTLMLSPSPTPNTATQTDPTGGMITYSATPIPMTLQVDHSGSSNMTLGPDFVWDLTVPAGESQSISITEAASGIHMAPTSIPAPSAGWTCLWTLAGLSAPGLLKRVRRVLA